MGTFVTTSVRKASPGCEVCILNAGGIRGNKKYDKQAFTYADLKTECPFDNPVVVIELPGQVRIGIDVVLSLFCISVICIQVA